MTFASRALNTMSDFVKNQKALVFGIGMMVSGMAASAQAPGVRITPKPHAPTETPVVTVTSPKTGKDTVIAQPSAVFPKAQKKARVDNGFWAFNVGAVHSSKNTLWNSGTQFDWHADVPLGKPGTRLHNWGELEGGYTRRNKGIGINYNYYYPGTTGAGGASYKVNEVYIRAKFGPDLAIPNKKNSRYNTAIVKPYVGFGGTYGWGTSTNEITYLSPETVEGVDLLLGKIAKPRVDKHGHEKTTGPTIAVKLFAEARQQHLNKNVHFGNQATNILFPPNAQTEKTSFRTGISVAFCIP